MDLNVKTITVEIHDLFGNRLSALVLPAQDSDAYAVKALSGGHANGMWMVSVSDGARTVNERLVIQH